MFIIDLANGRQQEFNLGRVAHLIYWSPDGQWLLFLSAQDDPIGLYLINNEGGEPYLFLEITGRNLPYDIYWLPDGASTP
jgi:Tol biopolymer transport system component